MKIWIGSDHGGFSLKQELLKWLPAQYPDAQISDVGASMLDMDDDYPQYAAQVAKQVSAANTTTQDPTSWGVLICRSGAGMAIAANRFSAVRAVVCRTVEDVVHAREHNNANIIVLEGDAVQYNDAQTLITRFFTTNFGEDRHVRRVEQLEALTQK